VDFGLAKGLPGTPAEEHDSLSDPLTRTGATLGTVGYAAPEQLTDRTVDPRTDQFGLCATLYELLFHRVPFSGETIDAMALATIAGRVDPPPAHTGVPDPVVAAILRGLAPSPSDRHPDIATLLRTIGA
jgi:eukaryotic-like serine/threonine-protein kinase